MLACFVKTPPSELSRSLGYAPLLIIGVLSFFLHIQEDLWRSSYSLNFPAANAFARVGDSVFAKCTLRRVGKPSDSVQVLLCVEWCFGADDTCMSKSEVVAVVASTFDLVFYANNV